eukprot:TRINITY_DN10431_c0_g1_i1.p1 TRINITY_DN10431_c0_g1~~TRINITY_DN10431_c0_g1_i1.p1  ORF type:complete len:179 (-),score=40.12 TRINITY_DN10431_c0_g1_i1:244-780(-)
MAAFAESNDQREDGALDTRLMSVWIPLSDTTVENGCMFVVPRPSDPEFDQDTSYTHMLPAQQASDSIQLNFALSRATALPCKAGSVLGWFGNLIHWGSDCQPHCADQPRSSLALTFRRMDLSTMAKPGESGYSSFAAIAYDEAKNLTVGDRLKLISQSIQQFKHWYTIPGSLNELVLM